LEYVTNGGLWRILALIVEGELMKKNLSEKEIEQLYGVGRRLLQGMRMRSEGPPFIKISGRLGARGGRVVYPVAGLEAWLASRPSGGGSAAEVNGQ
jgi:hypothetical protein